jgi:hypothetical protein
MQKIATRIFIWASILFGILGLSFVLTSPADNQANSNINTVIAKLLMATVFIILPSFALSVAGKYLDGKR